MGHFKETCRRKATEAKEGIHRVGLVLKTAFMTHPEATVIGLTIVSGLIGNTVKSVSKIVSVHKEEQLKTMFWYDNRLGKYWSLRKKPTVSQTLTIEQCVRNGEPLGKILDDMHLLKR